MSTTTTTTLPPIHSLHTLPIPDQSQTLTTLFEPSAALLALALPISHTPHPTYTALVAAIGTALRALPEDSDSLREILSSHPRLGEKRIDSALSRAEQGAMVAASGSGEGGGESEEETLRRLNGEYEARFPGLRYV